MTTLSPFGRLEDGRPVELRGKYMGTDGDAWRLEEAMFYCYPAMAPLFPEASRAMEEVCGLIRERLATT